jgi:hypothetical protein
MRRNLSFPGISRCCATGTGAGPGAWARTMSALGGCAGLPNPPVRRAVASFMSTLRSVTAAARRSQTPCARYWASNSPTGPPPNGLSTPSPSTLSPRTCTPPPARPGPGHPHVGGAAAVRIPVVAERLFERCGSPRRPGPRPAGSTFSVRCAITACGTAVTSRSASNVGGALDWRDRAERLRRGSPRMTQCGRSRR